jgi:hypothetical protein
LQPVAAHARRSQRWQLVGIGLTVATAGLAAFNARKDVWSAVVVLACGVSAVFGGRSLRAGAALLQITEPPIPRWSLWVSALSVVTGGLLILAGAAWLVQGWRAAP